MTEQNGLDTKQRLLEAAIKIFSDKGFKAATVREICQEADVNVAAVNYHFGDKDQLYGVVLREIFTFYDQARDAELAAIAADRANPAEARLRAHIVAGMLQTYEMDKCQNSPYCHKNQESPSFSLFLMEMAHPSSHLDEVVEQYIKPSALELYDILQQFFGPKADEAMVKRCSDSIWGQIMHRAMCAPIEDRLHGSGLAALDVRAFAEHICEFTLGGLNLIKQQLETE